MKWLVWTKADGEWHPIRALGTYEPVIFRTRYEARYFANKQVNYFENPKRFYRVIPKGKRPKMSTKISGK